MTGKMLSFWSIEIPLVDKDKVGEVVDSEKINNTFFGRVDLFEDAFLDFSKAVTIPIKEEFVMDLKHWVTWDVNHLPLYAAYKGYDLTSWSVYRHFLRNIGSSICQHSIRYIS